MSYVFLTVSLEQSLELTLCRFLLQEERTRGRIVDLLINKCADVNIRDDSGRTALSYACELRCNNIVRKLVRHNGDPDIADDKGKSQGSL